MKRTSSVAFSSKKSGVLLEKIEKERNEVESILKFDFKKKRAKILSAAEEVSDNGKAVLYWMNRDARVQDNWAFLFAQKLALKNELPLKVLFCLPKTKYLEYTLRHYKFLLTGLEEVAKECHNLNVEFHFKIGAPADLVTSFVSDQKIGAVVVDFLPLRDALEWQQSVLDQISTDIPFVRVRSKNSDFIGE